MGYEIEYKTKTGVPIYCLKNAASHSFFISLFVRAGSIFEDRGESGITHFFEHTAIRNINKLYGMELYSTLDRRGLEFNASTFSEMVQFYTSGASQNFKLGAEVITEILSPIILDKGEIDSERRRIKAEIRESNDKTSLATFSSGAVFEGTSLANSIVGTVSSIDKIGKQKLEEFRSKVICSENIFFYLTGNFTDDDLRYLAALIDEKKIPRGTRFENIAPVPKDFGKRDSRIHIKNADYTALRLSFDLDMERISVAEADLLYDMLLSGYNSRLFIELSEHRGLCYDLVGACERYKNIGTLYFSFEVMGKDIYEAAEVVVDVLNSFKTDPDADAMKAGYVDNAYMLFDDSRELNFTFAYDNHIMDEGYASIEERKARYESITSERLSEVARELFLPKNLVVTMKALKKKIDEERLKNIFGRLL